MIFIVLSVTIQPEIDLCAKNSFELTKGHFSNNTINANHDISIKLANSTDSDSRSTQQTHWFCHQGHVCHLIFWLPIALTSHGRENLKIDIFLFPPKELFLDGPFKPPKYLLG